MNVFLYHQGCDSLHYVSKRSYNNSFTIVVTKVAEEIDMINLIEILLVVVSELARNPTT